MTPVEGSIITFTPTGTTKSFRFFMPVGWSALDRWSLFHVGFYGDGQGTAASLTGEVPLNCISEQGWDGKVYLNDGNVAKFAILGCPNYTTDYAAYRLAILECISSIGIDTFETHRLSASGFSGGPPRMWLTLRNYNDVAFMFQRTVNMSTGSINGTTGGFITDLTKKGFHQVWHSVNDNNGGTVPEYSKTLYTYFQGSRRSIHWTQESGHSGITWDEVMNVRGLGTPNGGTARSQDGGRWRFLADPYDGLNMTTISMAGTAILTP